MTAPSFFFNLKTSAGSLRGKWQCDRQSLKEKVLSDLGLET